MIEIAAEIFDSDFVPIVVGAAIDDLVARYTGQSHLILGVSDMVTADCDWDRLLYITEAVNSV